MTIVFYKLPVEFFNLQAKKLFYFFEKIKKYNTVLIVDDVDNFFREISEIFIMQIRNLCIIENSDFDDKITLKILREFAKNRQIQVERGLVVANSRGFFENFFKEDFNFFLINDSKNKKYDDKQIDSLFRRLKEIK